MLAGRKLKEMSVVLVVRRTPLLVSRASLLDGRTSRRNDLLLRLPSSWVFCIDESPLRARVFVREFGFDVQATNNRCLLDARTAIVVCGVVTVV